MNLISVILCAYNEPIFMIKKSVESILKQTYRNIELILINDNPNYDELNQLFVGYQEADERVRYFRHHVNKGLVCSLNEGIEVASGDFIARMDADDVSFPERLEKQMKYLQVMSYDMVGCNVRKIDEDDNEIGEVKVPSSFEFIKKYQLYGSCVLHPTWLVKKKIYEELVGYRFIYACEDYDFILRAIQHGFRIGNLSEVELLYRIRSNSISNSANIKQKLTMYFLVDNGGINKEVSIDKINTYLESDTYKKAYLKLNKYESIKQSIRESNSKIRKLPLVFGIVFNKYFYKNIVEHYMLKKRLKE